ncbi:hypothetical protein [Dongia mobilis]|uniref:hypothetical protein n=1 Tax=Dongia sp. TaxID=1977262 RepID=UPI0026E956AC
MIYLVALILPPLALLLYGKVFQAIFNLLLYALAWVAFFCHPAVRWLGRIRAVADRGAARHLRDQRCEKE